MSNSSIAQSERINIPVETKQEIVSTLKMYPLVLQELKVKDDLLDKCNEIRGIQELEIQVRDDKINNLFKQIDNVEKQNKLLRKQIRYTRNSFIGGGIAIVGLVVVTSLLF